MENAYLEFLRYCLDDGRVLPKSAKGIDWIQMMAWAELHAIVGVIYTGIQKSGRDLGMPFDTLMVWIGYAQQIETQNRIVNKRCCELTREFAEAGFDTCILKGQGNALLYPNPLMRTSGDIDILLLPQNYKSVNERRKLIGEYVNSRYPGARIRYQHIDYPKFNDVEVEVHFIPTAKNNPIYNKRIQSWVEGQLRTSDWKKTVELPNCEGTINVPSMEFNLIYQMSHLMHHFFDEGIGLRQFIDYYYLIKGHTDGRPLAEEGHTETTALELCSLATNGTQEITERRPMVEEGHTDDTDGTDSRSVAEVGRVLRRLNLDRFAGAVMYVLKEVLGLEERYLIVPVDERRGKTLMEEVMKGGNFGRASGLTNHSMGMKYLLKTKRNLRLAREYPAEALCEPFFRTWHFLWRALKS